MESSESAGNIVAVLRVMDASLPIVADLVRLIDALARKHGTDVAVEIRDIETDALKIIDETEKILDDVSGAR